MAYERDHIEFSLNCDKKAEARVQNFENILLKYDTGLSSWRSIRSYSALFQI